MMSRRIRSAGLIVVFVAGGFGLVGCDRAIGLDDPVQLRVVDGELQFRVCTSAVVTSVVVEARGDGEWEYVWNARGTTEFERGEVIATSTLEDVFETVNFAFDPAMESGGDVAVTFDMESGNLSGSFVLNDSAISGEWIGTENNPESSC